jgi:hypothetical protein
LSVAPTIIGTRDSGAQKWSSFGARLGQILDQAVAGR